MEKRKKIVIFGIFDGIHEGHRDFFRQAKECGDELVVIVGRDAISERLKNKKPTYSEQERLKSVGLEPLVDKVVLGDKELSSYEVLGDLNPDVICFGYDQEQLSEDLKKWLEVHKKEAKIHHLQPYEEDTFHNSLL